MYRFYNTRTYTHLYTSDSNEVSHVKSSLPDYRYEGIKFGAVVSRYYANCTEAHNANITPIYLGQPGYGAHLDRDGDGIACETGATGTVVAVVGDSRAYVTNIVDGDTLDASINGSIYRVRLIGVNTPETVDPNTPQQCYGAEASNYSKSRLTGKDVTLKADYTQSNTDKYGRLLRYVIVDGSVNFNEELIRYGYDKEYTYANDYIYKTSFITAQTIAQQNLSGLWSPTTCNGVF